MKKVIKILIKIVGYIILAIIALVLIVILLLQLEPIQNKVANIAINALQKQTNLDISLKKLKIKSFNTIELDSLHINDHKDNNLIYLGQAKVRLKDIDLVRNTFYFKEIIIRDLDCDHVKYLGDSISNLKMMLNDLSNDKKKEKKEKKYPFTFLSDYIRFYNIDYLYKDENYVAERETESLAIDFKDIDLTEVYGEFMDFTLIKDSITSEVINISLKEKSGFAINSFNSDVTFSSSTIITNNTSIITPNSDIVMDMTMSYPSLKVFKHFLDSVSFNANLKDTKLNLIDVSYFSSSLAGADNLIEVNAKIDGPVNDMAVTNAELYLYDITYYYGDVFLKDVDKDIYLKLDIKNFITDANDIESFTIPAFKTNVYDPKNLVMPKQVHKLGTISLSGIFDGKITDFKSDLGLFTQAGNLNIDANYSELTQNKEIFDIKLNGKKLNIGELLDISQNITTIDADINAIGTASKFKPNDYKLEGKLSNINLSKVILSDLFINLENEGDLLKSNINIFDENVFLQLFLSYLQDEETPILNSSIDINHMNLNNLGLLNSDDIYNVSGFINANATGKELDNMNAQINISDLELKKNDTLYYFKDLTLVQNTDTANYKDIEFKSNFLDIYANGNFKYSDFGPIFNNIINNIIPKQTDDEYDINNKIDNNTLLAEENSLQIADNTNFQVFVNLKNTDLITQLLVPQLNIADNSSLNLKLDNPENLQLDANINSLAFNNMLINNINIDANYNNGFLTNNITSDKFILNQESNSLDFIDFSNIILSNKLHNDTLLLNLSWVDSIFYNTNKINLLANISDFPNLTINLIDTNSIYLQHDRWDLSTDGDIKYSPELISVDNLYIKNDTSYINIHGNLSNSISDSLSVNFNNLDLAVANLFLSDNMNIQGILEGDVSVAKADNNPFFSANLSIEDIYLNNKDFGNIILKSNLDNNQNIIAEAYALQRGNRGIDTVINLNGVYKPFSKNGDINGNLSLSNLDFKFLEPFLQSVISNPYGFISGNLDISNNIHNPKLAGELNFRRSGLTINFTGATYSFSNKLIIEPNAIVFKDFRLYDDKGKWFDLFGSISHDNFSDFVLDLNTEFDNFIVIDNPSDYDNLFHGKTVLSGNAGLHGDLNNIRITASVESMPETDMTIELSSGKTASEFAFINFINPNDSSEVEIITKQGGININAHAKLTQDANLNIVLPYSIGEMEINGNGDITYRQSKDGNMVISGDYNINEGKLDINFQNMLKRKFTIKEGGSIRFNGDPLDASMDVEAIYQVRAPLSGIPTISDPALTERKIPVDCIIRFSGTLTDPLITYDLEFPNVEDNIQSLIYGSIDMNDQAAISEQVFSLLVMKTFMFSTDNSMLSSGIGANSLDFISSQISNWLSLISHNIDINVNYNEAGEFNPEEVEISVKTTLFNDRLIINSNIGVQGETTTGVTQNTSGIVGDFEAEYKITKDGLLRGKVFNKSNEYNILEPNAPYTQGIGISYHTEFDKISDIFENRRKKKNRKNSSNN